MSENVGRFDHLGAVMPGHRAETNRQQQDRCKRNPCCFEDAANPVTPLDPVCGAYQAGGQDGVKSNLTQNCRGLVDDIDSGSENGEEQQSQDQEQHYPQASTFISTPGWRIRFCKRMMRRFESVKQTGGRGIGGRKQKIFNFYVDLELLI